ncbi:hypothetical protein [Nocardia neocaledoniensis]|uniref:hypothetical protein n=1 Tax=Nocardia neocaledoniensis TaxID=236511 RepID=UPI0024555B18|nr:hypothetical protein [Nocardia neocaledoniensis]
MTDYLSPQPPVVPVVRQWNERASRGVIAFTALMAVALLTAASGWLVMAIRDDGAESFVTILGHIGAIGLFLGAAGLFGARLLTMFPRAAETVAPTATRTVDPEWGSGIHLRQESSLLSLELTLAGCALFGFAAWWEWHSGGTDGLLPFSRNNSGGAIGGLVFSIVALVALVLMVFARFARVRWELYPAGIICRMPMRGVSRIGWSEISSVRGDVCKLSAQYNAAPVVLATLTDSSRPAKHKLFDRVGELGIPACILRCDSDLLLALVKHLLAEPDSRDLLATEAAAAWFTERYHQLPTE